MPCPGEDARSSTLGQRLPYRAARFSQASCKAVCLVVRFKNEARVELVVHPLSGRFSGFAMALPMVPEVASEKHA